MRIDGSPDSSPPLPGTSTSPAAAASSRDEFLRLFVAQLAHQDPLDPQKGADFVAQLAQFSTLEQSAAMNAKLGDLLTGQAAAARASMAGMVGRTATVRADTLQLNGTAVGPPGLGVQLDGAAASVSVAIKDSSGKVVRTLSLGACPAGRTDTRWDGTDDRGVPLPAGSYSVEVTAKDAAGAKVSAYGTLRGLISALELSGGGTKFRVGVATVSPGDVMTLE
jgi:flagellar basal-body rod modification protein FlgD